MIAQLAMVYASVIVGGIVVAHWPMRDRTLEIAVARDARGAVGGAGIDGVRDGRRARERAMPSSTSSSEPPKGIVRARRTSGRASSADRVRSARASRSRCPSATSRRSRGADPARRAGAVRCCCRPAGNGTGALRRRAGLPQQRRAWADAAPAHRRGRGPRDRADRRLADAVRRAAAGWERSPASGRSSSRSKARAGVCAGGPGRRSGLHRPPAGRRRARPVLQRLCRSAATCSSTTATRGRRTHRPVAVDAPPRAAFRVLRPRLRAGDRDPPPGRGRCARA